MSIINQTWKGSLAKSPTGIQGLDEITNGGLPQGRPTLICGKAGCGKTLLAMEFLVRGASQYQEPGVFLSFEESVQELAENVYSFGWDLDTLTAEKQLALRFIQIDRSQTGETGEFDLEALFVRLGHAIDSVQAKRVVLDTLEVLFGGVSNTAIVRSELQRLFLWLKARKVTAIVTAESGENSPTRHGIEEFVSDCVILLDQRTYNDLATRRLRILKYRGSSHGSNEYPFLIEENGISVLPLSSVGMDYQASSEQISTGIARLDRMLGGQGYYRGSSILISGTAGTGKSSLCALIASATCHRGERCLYLAFEESANQIIRNMRSIGVDLATPVQQGWLKFQALRPTAYGLELHLVKIHQLVRDFQPKTVIIDPISNLHYAGTSLQVQAFMMRLIDFFKTQQISTILTNLTSGSSALEQTEVGISSLADTWLLLRDQETNGERNRLIYVLKSRGMNHSNQVREFRLTRNGIQLLDVYLGTEGVLTGTARLVQEAQEKANALAQQQELDRKQRELKRKRVLMEAQIVALQAEFEAEQEEIERAIAQEQKREQIRLQDQRDRAQLRQADHEAEAD
ncbi:MAG: circadian clock protein KaiC [Pantanalinema sp. GBBB05]|nr:circadian clock protein KaiC [Pantanalinema sp. GBBB05]